MEQYTKKELLDLAKKYHIVGRWDMSKEELIEEIEKKKNLAENNEDSEKEDVKNKYLKTVEVGCLVAFDSKDGRIRSAKIIKRSTKQRMLIVETEYNASFTISFDDVIWIKTGNRWPKGVYELLKGVRNEKEKEAAK